jgi:hypothetical protein
MKLLHLDSSIQGGKSASRAISAAEVEQLSSGNTELEIVYRDLRGSAGASYARSFRRCGGQGGSDGIPKCGHRSDRCPAL